MQSGVYSKLKQQSSSSSSSKMRQIYDLKIKGSSWNFGNHYDYSSCNNGWGEGDLVAAGYSWPPRSYTCSFCKREFRSAQALGGHMNVHRRDRARLRQSPPTISVADCNTNCSSGQFSLLNLNIDPNPNFSPNPNFFPPHSNSNLSSLVTKFPQFTAQRGKKLDSSGLENGPMTKDLIRIREKKGVFGLGKFECEKGCGVVRLDLEIGLIGESKEELDLELRLGQYS